MSEFFKKNVSLIFFALMIIAYSLILCAYAVRHTVPKIDMSNIYESFNEYSFSILDENPRKKVSDSYFITEWNQGQEPYYIQLFDMGFVQPPSVLFQEKALIPENSKQFQVDFKIAGTYGTNLTVFLMFYDENNRIKNDISTITLTNPRNIDNSNTNKFEITSLKSKIEPEFKYYKIAIKIFPPEGKNGFIRLEDLDIIFH